MKDLDSIAGQLTPELPGITRRGRPPKHGRAMTNAERQKAFRERNKGAGQLVDKILELVRQGPL